ncbi:MAG TPA: dihydrodipicolinate synthase family protein [Chthonomonadaceae bacterium]|nr:dihydrodipicolinate synthase family protein [Chthonomonadaceae bacterium]
MPHPNAAKLRGLLPAILTPLDLNGDLALEHFPALLDFQRRAGMDGVVVCGTNGEGTALSVAERKQTIEKAIQHRGNFVIIAGTGATSVTDAVELTRHAASVGADAALVLPPFFMKNPKAAGLAAYFRPILDAADLPILLYSIPQFSAVPITDELMALLADHPNLFGVKDSAGDWTRTHEFITRYPHLRIFAGSDRLAARSYAHGGSCISGGANAFPEIVVAIRDAWNSHGDGPELAAAQARLDALIDITIRYPFVTSSKSILAHRGLPRLGVRPPLTLLAPDVEANLLAELRDAKFL